MAFAALAPTRTMLFRRRGARETSHAARGVGHPGAQTGAHDALTSFNCRIDSTRNRIQVAGGALRAIQRSSMQPPVALRLDGADLYHQAQSPQRRLRLKLIETFLYSTCLLLQRLRWFELALALYDFGVGPFHVAALVSHSTHTRARDCQRHAAATIPPRSRNTPPTPFRPRKHTFFHSWQQVKSQTACRHSFPETPR